MCTRGNVAEENYFLLSEYALHRIDDYPYSEYVWTVAEDVTYIISHCPGNRDLIVSLNQIYFKKYWISMNIMCEILD